MANLKGDQFYVVDPAQPPKAGTSLKPLKMAIGDMNGNHIMQPNSGDLVGGLKVTAVWVNDTITVDLGHGPVKITGVTFYRQGGPAVFTPTDGTVLHEAKLVKASYVKQSTQVNMATFGPPCFAFGTAILAQDGPRLVQDLRPGDLISTRDHGLQALRWIGRQTVCGLGRFAPIHFLPGALGNDGDLLVSPQHRMLVSGWRAELLFGQAEVLIAAKHLVNGTSILPCYTPEVEYFHLLLGAHEIVFAEGIPTKSFFPGAACIASDRNTFLEVTSLFPNIHAAGTRWIMAAPTVKGAEAAAIRF